MDAFEFFISNESSLNSLGKELGYAAFKATLNSLLPKRFDTNEINWLWNKCSGAAETLDYGRFIIAFDCNKFMGPKKLLSLNTST